MNKYWKIFEKSISIITVVIGAIAFAVLIPLHTHHEIPFFSTEFLHIKVLAIMAVLGGILLFFEKKSGWIISAGICFSCFVIYGFGFQRIIYNGFDPITETIIAIIFLIMLVFGILLVSKPFIAKYTANLTSFMLIALIVSFFIINIVISMLSKDKMEEISINFEKKPSITQKD